MTPEDQIREAAGKWCTTPNDLQQYLINTATIYSLEIKAFHAGAQFGIELEQKRIHDFLNKSGGMKEDLAAFEETLKTKPLKNTKNI